MSANRNAPASNRGASAIQIQPESTPSEAALLAAARGYCVLVSSNEGKYRRRLYLSLSAAQSAVERARAHGKYAALVLAVVTPVGVAE